MRTLWARTIRARNTIRSRRCRLYSTAVARRGTTAATSRAFPFPTSTILYSAIFAAAAVADGHVKEQRRSRWNAAISDARYELEHQQSHEEGRVQEQGWDSTMGIDAVLPAPRVDDTDGFMEEKMDPEHEDWLYLQKYSTLRPERPDWTDNLGSSLEEVERNLPPQSLYAPFGRKGKGLRQGWSRRKLQTVNYSMANLVLLLLRNSNFSERAQASQEDIPESLVPFTQMKAGDYRLKMDELSDQCYKTKEVPRAFQHEIPDYVPLVGQLPDYRQDTNGYYHHETARLNEFLIDAFERHYSGRIFWHNLADQICDRLLTSTAPPNVTTYNTLIAGFSTLKQKKLCNYMIDSIRVCHIRPDEVTITTILRHFRNEGEKKKFTKFVREMRGAYQALMLARPTLKANSIERTEGFVLPKPDGSQKLLQKVRPTPKVLTELVRGYLCFFSFEDAVKRCADLAKDGWGLSIDALHLFLQACVKRRDWESGQAIWSQLEALQQRSRLTMFHRQWETMLELCWLCDREMEFRKVYQKGVAYAGQPRIFKNFLRSLQGRREEKLAGAGSPDTVPNDAPLIEIPSMLAF